MPNIIIQDADFNRNAVDTINKKYINEFPVVYIIRDKKKENAYIGETFSIKRRMKEHLKKEKNKSLEIIHIIGEERFNKSAALGIETKMLNYFIGDQKYKISNRAKVKSDISHDYYQKELYEDELFSDIWKKLIEKDIVRNKRDVIENRDVFKLSPYKELTKEQLDLKETIIDFCESALKEKNKAPKNIVYIRRSWHW